MFDPRSKELINAENLMYNGRVEEAHKLILNYENDSKLTPKDKLYSLLLKGWIYLYNIQYEKAVEVGELAYQMCQELEMGSETIEALLLKAQVLFQEKDEEAAKVLLEVENLINSKNRNLAYNKPKIEIEFFLAKGWFFFQKGDYLKAIDLARKGLNLGKKYDLKLSNAHFLYQLGYNFHNKGEYETAFNYQMKSLELLKELNNQVGMAASLSLIGVNYVSQGDLEQALKFIEQSLAINEISFITKNFNFLCLGNIHRDKGEIFKAIKYLKKVEDNIDEHSILYYPNNFQLGITYRLVGNYNLAVKYLHNVLTAFKQKEHSLGIIYPLLNLLLISIENESYEPIQEYLNQMIDVANKTENKVIIQGSHLAKALVLKTSNRRRKLTEAEIILRNIINEDIIDPEFYVLSLTILCDLLLQELSMYNNPEVLDEIDPLIIHLLDIAKINNSYLWLAEGTLLKAKLALIQMDVDNAKKFLIEAQHIAELHGLKLLAQTISSEHDKLLEQIDKWDNIKNQDSSMSERVELASFDGVIDRFQGKRTVEPPELVEEEQILLLIMDNSGSTYFNHTFVPNWDFSDLFSSFMSAFNSFSSEIFSKSIDRIKIGENTILINPIESFLVCYVIKGQSYPALQKLTRFSTVIRENEEIWQALNNSVKTSEVLELNNPPSLKIIVNEIFTQQS